MFGIKNLLGIGTRSKIFKEYNQITELEDKRFLLQGKYGTINEDVQLQKKILWNNLTILGRLYEDLGVPVISKNLVDSSYEYFNIQGTKPNIIFSKEYIPSTMTHSKTKSVTYIYNLKHYNLIGIMKDFENFNDISHSTLSIKIKENILNKIKSNMDKEIKKLVNLFKGNEDYVYKFILGNLMDEKYLDTEKMIKNTLEKYNFVYSLFRHPHINVSSQGYSIKNKDIILINEKVFCPGNAREFNISEFLKDFKQNKYDYIIT